MRIEIHRFLFYISCSRSQFHYQADVIVKAELSNAVATIYQVVF